MVNVPSSGWWRTACEVVSVAKSLGGNVRTVLMGMHASVKPVECLLEGKVDFVVVGEPEFTVLELVDTLEKGDLAALGEAAGFGCGPFLF